MDTAKWIHEQKYVSVESFKKDIRIKIMEAKTEREKAVENEHIQSAYERDIEIKTYENVINMINELAYSDRYATIVSEVFEMRMHIANEMLEKMPVEKTNDYIKNEIINSCVFKEHIKNDIEIHELTNWPSDFAKTFKAEYKTYRSTKGGWPCL